MYYQGAQESGIPVIPGIVMGYFFSVRVYLRNLGMSWDFFIDNFDILFT